jgi:thymidylate kinase
MSRLIIFEGTDGTGKSFASVQTYRELDRAALLHYGPPAKSSFISEYYDPVDELLQAGFTDVVVDRFHWGERVWPTLFKRDALGGYESWLYLERALLELFDHVIVVLMEANAEFIQTTLRKRGEDEDAIVKALVAMSVYKIIADESQLPVIRTTRFRAKDEVAAWLATH